MTRKTSTTTTHADVDPNAVVDAIVQFVANTCAGRNDALPSPFNEAANANAAERAMLKALYDGAKRNPAYFANDALAPVLETIADADPPDRVARIAQAILAFAPPRTSGNLKETVEALMDILATTYALNSPGAAAAVMSDVTNAIDADINVGEYHTATAFAKAAAAHTLATFDRDANVNDSELTNAAMDAAFKTFFAYEQHEFRTADDQVKAIAALTTYALIKGDTVECAEIRQVLARDGDDIDANALSQVVGNIIAVAQPATEAQRAFVQNILPGIDTATMTKQHAHNLIEEYKAKRKSK